jgi:DNA-binding NarL/FixJ family response regulator
MHQHVPPTARDAGRPIRIVIADDHTLFAEALALAFKSDPRFDVVGLAENGEEALELAASRHPEVVLMDLHMPVMDGIEATQRLRLASPGARVVVVTASTSPEDSERARAAGAVAYIRKWSSADELREAVEEAAADAAPLETSRSPGRWRPFPLLRSA